MKSFKFPIISVAICFTLTLIKMVQNQRVFENMNITEAVLPAPTYSFSKSNLNFLDESKIDSSLKEKSTSSLDQLTDGLYKSSNIFQKVVDIFKTKNNTELKEIVQGKGFGYFAATGQVKISKGIKEQFMDKYIQNLSRLLKVPESHKNAILGILDEIGFSDKNIWTNFKTAFNIGADSESKFCSIYFFKDDLKDAYDIVYIDFQGTFKLAPDTLVIKKSTMVLVGVWTEEQEVYEKIDSSLTHGSIDNVMNFFSILSLKGIGDVLGIKLEFPKF